MTKFVGLRAKSCGSLRIKSKRHKMCVRKGKIKFENYKNGLEAAQPCEINDLEKKINIMVSFVIKKHKEFIKGNKLILKTKQKCKSDRHNVLTEEINRTDLSSKNC